MGFCRRKCKLPCHLTFLFLEICLSIVAFRTRGKYVHDGKEERFTTITALVFFQCVVNYLYAYIMSFIFPTTEKDTTKSSYYGLCSLTYLVAMVSSNKALSWVNYPTQVIGKSCKPIPVMVLGVLVGRKRYPLLKYLFILMIVAGVAMFMYKDGSKKGGQGGEGLIGVGEVLLLVSLTCDGLTGAIQVAIISYFIQTSSCRAFYFVRSE